jgi:hypothetical protein
MCLSCEVDMYLYKLFRRITDCRWLHWWHGTYSAMLYKLQRILTFRNQQILSWLCIARKIYISSTEGNMKTPCTFLQLTVNGEGSQKLLVIDSSPTVSWEMLYSTINNTASQIRCNMQRCQLPRRMNCSNKQFGIDIHTYTHTHKHSFSR